MSGPTRLPYNGNLPPGVSDRDIDRAAGNDHENTCSECGAYLDSMQEIATGLCAEHLKIVSERLPE